MFFVFLCVYFFFFFQAEDGIRDRSPSRGLGDVYKRQDHARCKGFISLSEESHQNTGQNITHSPRRHPRVTATINCNPAVRGGNNSPCTLQQQMHAIFSAESACNSKPVILHLLK